MAVAVCLTLPMNPIRKMGCHLRDVKWVREDIPSQESWYRQSEEHPLPFLVVLNLRTPSIRSLSPRRQAGPVQIIPGLRYHPRKHERQDRVV